MKAVHITYTCTLYHVADLLPPKAVHQKCVQYRLSIQII
jgi:hypothetical protein